MFHFEDPSINSQTFDLLIELFDTFDGSDEEKNLKTQFVLEKLIEECLSMMNDSNKKEKFSNIVDI